MISNYLAVSTAHITEQDNNILMKACVKDPFTRTFPLSVAEYEYGYYIRLVDLKTSPTLYKDLLKHKMSLSFVKLVIYARKKECILINLDCDEVTLNNLDTHCW